MSDQEVGEIGGARCELVLKVLDELIRQNSVSAPRHNIVIKNIAVSQQHITCRKIKMMEIGDIGIVIAREKLDRRGTVLGEICELGSALIDRIGISFGASVRRISITDQAGSVGREGRELLQSMHGAGSITVVDVGDDAKLGGHGGGKI